MDMEQITLKLSREELTTIKAGMADAVLFTNILERQARAAMLVFLNSSDQKEASSHAAHMEEIYRDRGKMFAAMVDTLTKACTP